MLPFLLVKFGILCIDVSSHSSSNISTSVLVWGGDEGKGRYLGSEWLTEGSWLVLQYSFLSELFMSIKGLPNLIYVLHLFIHHPFNEELERKKKWLKKKNPHLQNSLFPILCLTRFSGVRKIQ
jgi:hypothetical protein